MIDDIVKFTNQEGQTSMGENWKQTDSAEICRFIGLSVLAGVYRSNHESTSSLWDTAYGRSIFRETMSLIRFKLLNSKLRFDDKRTREERVKDDNL